MIVDTPLQLGQSTNLLSGYEANAVTAPFRPSQKPALYETQIKLKDPDYEATWSWPTITFHETTEELVSALVQVKLRKESFEDEPSEGGGVAKWPAGALMLKGLTSEEYQAALQNLSSQLDLDLSTAGWSYTLVRRTRKVGTAVYKSYERGLFRKMDGTERASRSDFYTALRHLEKLGPHSTDVTKDGANGYINLYGTYGSHFISMIEAGDSLFQVFAYGPEEFKYIVDYYADKPEYLSGPLSPTFILYTVPHGEAGYGYTAASGTLVCTSGDPALAQSLEDGLWLDTDFSGTNNIFTPLVTSGSININVSLKMITVTWIELASLNAFAEYYRKLIWRRVFKGAMYAKYADGLGVAPYFPNNCPYDLETVYKDSDPIDDDGLVSTLATPTVDIWQELADLNLIKLQFSELVETFSVFANAIKFPPPTNSPDVQVPGSSIVSFLTHVISTGGVGPIPPNLKISETAFTKIKDKLFCGEFYGGLRVSSIDGSQSLVIMNSLIFEYRDKVSSVVRDTRECPPNEYLAARLTDIQFGLVAAEARLNFYLTGNSEDDEAGLDLIQRYLLWLGNLGCTDQEYSDEVATLLARALYLANVAAMGPGAGIPVPYLNFDAYRDVVNNVQNVLRTATDELTNMQQQIRERMAEERLLDNLQILNENIIASGQLLLDFIGVQADYQESIAAMFQNVVSDKEKELELALQRAKELNDSLDEQRLVVEEAVAEYKKAVVDWYKREMIEAALEIALNLFIVGFTIAVPAGSILALQSLGKTVQKIQKAVYIFHSVIEAYQAIEAIPENPQDVVDSFQKLEEMGVELPTALEWDEMDVNMDATLDTGPEVNEKYTLSAAFDILVLRGKALVECQDEIQKIASDLSTAQARVKLSEDQKKRLEDLKATFNVLPEDLDVAKVDLIGLSGQLIFFQRQMLMTLAETVVIQDRALQYEYIRPPTPIVSFTMLNLQLAMLNQSQSINQGLTVQPTPEDQEYPIIYEVHGVKPESLINKHAYTFNIALNKREFASYNYVRVKQVDVEIGGIVSTESGKYYTELTFDGNPFYDRGFDGEPLTFKTVSRIYTGLHDVSSSSHVPPLEKSAPTQEAKMYLGTTGRSSFDNISLITPFSAWKISLPPTSSNEGITFDDSPRGVTVRLIFHIFAQLKEEVLPPSEMFQRSRDLILSRGYGPKRMYVAPITKPSDTHKKSSKVDSAVNCLRQPTQPTTLRRFSTRNVGESDVLGMMEGKSVCAGWDVVFSMTAQQVNEQLRLQYEDRQGVPAFMRETGDQISESTTSEGLRTQTAYNFKFDAPRLEFLLNNSNSAQVFLPMIGGYYKYSFYVNDDWMIVDQHEIQVADGSYVQGDVPLAALQGSVSSQDNVCVKLNDGGFSAQDFVASSNNPTFDAILTKYFTSLGDGYEVYNFGTIDYQGISVLDSLKPTAFLFNVYHTPSDRDLLQMFIVTTGQQQSATVLYLKEPIPTSNQSSIIINTKIFFEDILPVSLGDGGIGLALKANEPSNDSNKDKVWSSTATSGTVSAPYPPTMVQQITQPVPNVGTKYIRYWIKVPGDTVYVYLTNMMFQSGDKNSLWNAKEVYDLKQANYDYQAGDQYRVCTFYCPDWSSIHYTSETVLVDISMHTGLPFKVTGTGQNQELEIASATSDVKLTGYVEPTGSCGCDGQDLQEDFVEDLEKLLPPKMTAVFNQKFNSVSIFALKNILFPAKNVMDMTKAYVPGDMVIFGNFTDTPAK